MLEFRLRSASWLECKLFKASWLVPSSRCLVTTGTQRSSVLPEDTMCKTAWSPPGLLTAQRNSHFGLDDVGVYLSDSVDGVRPHDAQVRHVHPLASVLLDQRHLPQLVHVVRVESCDVLQATQSRRTGG